MRRRRAWALVSLAAALVVAAAGFALAEGSFFFMGLIAWGVLVNALAVYRRYEIYLPRFVVNVAVLVATARNCRARVPTSSAS